MGVEKERRATGDDVSEWTDISELGRDRKIARRQGKKRGIDLCRAWLKTVNEPSWVLPTVRSPMSTTGWLTRRNGYFPAPVRFTTTKEPSSPYAREACGSGMCFRESGVMGEWGLVSTGETWPPSGLWAGEAAAQAEQMGCSQRGR